MGWFSDRPYQAMPLTGSPTSSGAPVDGGQMLRAGDSDPNAPLYPGATQTWGQLRDAERNDFATGQVSQPMTYGMLGNLGMGGARPMGPGGQLAQRFLGGLPPGLQNNPGLAQSGATPTPGGIWLKAPDGTTQQVDPAHVNHFLSKGAQMVSGGSGMGSAAGSAFGSLGGFAGGLF